MSVGSNAGSCVGQPYGKRGGQVTPELRLSRYSGATVGTCQQESVFLVRFLLPNSLST